MIVATKLMTAVATPMTTSTMLMRAPSRKVRAGKKGQRQRMGWQRDAGDGVEPIKGLCGLLLIPIYRYFAHAWHGLAKYWGLGFALCAVYANFAAE